MSCCTSCGTQGNWFNGCCPSCQPANVAIRGQCTDPGTITSARHLIGLDVQFCHGRIVNNAGLLSNELNGSGNSSIAWRQSPKIDPESVTAQENISFGNLLIVGSDSRLHQLQMPNTSGLVLQTNGSGDLVLNPVPAATVPDPLNVNDLSVANDATLENLEVNGDVELNGITSGTAVSLLALDATNHVVLQGLAQGLSISMFFESPTSPSGGTPPNKNKTSGNYLVIGNRLFDSGQDNIGVTTSESLTVNDAGNYLIMWQAQVRLGGGTGRKAGVWLEINGTVVNQGTGRTDAQASGIESVNGAMFPATGMDVRTYAANDVIKLLFNAAGAGPETYEVRLIAVRIP